MQPRNLRFLFVFRSSALLIGHRSPFYPSRISTATKLGPISPTGLSKLSLCLWRACTSCLLFPGPPRSRTEARMSTLYTSLALSVFDMLLPGL